MAEEPEEGTRLTAAQIHENVLRPAEHEIRRPAAALLLSALAAGLVIGFSCLAAAFAASVVPEPYKHAAAAAGYPLGFIFVIMARSELFTENTLVPVVPLLERRDLETLGLVARIWALLLIGNLVGTAVFALVLARTDLLRPEYAWELLRISRQATEAGFGHIVFAGVFAGWLMALLAWLLASTTSSLAQIVLIWLCTAPISALHFRHSIVGSTEAFYRAALADASWGAMLWGFVTPAVLGNAIGGVLLVALLNYGQVLADRSVERV
ncbi:MAG TPA: formate/nitrite transporter family protein [Gemmatimonadales bacterium]|nr:formate/nitrite transporter family protein [Gemmatimonadales bacterium]